jgi:hypothetical protein
MPHSSWRSVSNFLEFAAYSHMSFLCGIDVYVPQSAVIRAPDMPDGLPGLLKAGRREFEIEG